MLTQHIDHDVELRLLQEDDAESAAAVTDEVSPDETGRWIRGLLDLYRAGKEVPCAVCVAGEMAGYVLLEIHERGEGLRHYGLLPAYRGRGIATRACAALIEHAFTELGLSALKVDPPTANDRSCRVAERLGFVNVGIVQVPTERGQVSEVARYRLTAGQWYNSTKAPKG